MLVLGLNYTISIGNESFQVVGIHGRVSINGLGDRSVSPVVHLMGNDGKITEVEGAEIEGAI